MMVVVLLLKQELLGSHVGSKGNHGDAEAGSSALESVSSSEVGLVSPGLSVVSIGWLVDWMCVVSAFWRSFERLFER